MTSTPPTGIPHRKVALTAGFGLLLIALLAPFAQFGVLQNLVVPADATATANNILASEGLFRIGIAAFLAVIMLDVVVAWALYVLLRPVSDAFALLVAWGRVVYAAVFATALANLFDAVQFLGGADDLPTLPPEQLHAQAMASIASFENGWGVGLAIFGLHLVGLGSLLVRSKLFPRLLGLLVILAGGGYLMDSFGMILVPDYALNVSLFTFVGEALLIVWLFLSAKRGPASELESQRAPTDR